MEYMKIGHTDINASAITFGAMPIGGGTWWSGSDDKVSIDTIHRAYDLGINTIDTAPIYGLGHSEEVVGKAIAGQRDKYVISTKATFDWDTGEGRFWHEVDGHKVVLLKPLTYMNLSGDSIAPLAGFFKIPADHVIVLCDDITQAPGKLRIRPSGSAGGHNGLKSIIARLGGENFPRIRIGVGAKPRPDYDLADWVLGKFPPEDAKAMADRYPDLEAAAKLIMDGKLGLAQSKYNG